MALSEMAQELLPVGMGHKALLWDDEPQKISYGEEDADSGGIDRRSAC